VNTSTLVKIDIGDTLECRTRRGNGDHERVRVDAIEGGTLVGPVLNPKPGETPPTRRIPLIPAFAPGGYGSRAYKVISKADGTPVTYPGDQPRPEPTAPLESTVSKREHGYRRKSFAEIMSSPEIVAARRERDEQGIDHAGAADDWGVDMILADQLAHDGQVRVMFTRRGQRYTMHAVRENGARVQVVARANSKIHKSVWRFMHTATGVRREGGMMPVAPEAASTSARLGREVDWGDVRAGEIALDREAFGLRLFVRMRVKGGWVAVNGLAVGDTWHSVASVSSVRDVAGVVVSSKALIVAVDLPNASAKTIAAAWQAWEARAT
jgi:hypothetical protein